MKIKELTNAPQWLLDAVTRDEDVEIDQYGRVIWNRGSWYSGDFMGGNFLGGDFLGGNFLGGNFRGGNFLGGNFLGGNVRGGNFLGEKITLKPLSIYGLRWTVVITDARMMIGCQIHPLADWATFDDKTIAEMDGRDALRFWRDHKDALLGMARAAGRSFESIQQPEATT